MRPYLAIIKDSFREALASRVLWILLLLITVMFLGFAPLGWHRELTSRIGRDDLSRFEELARRLVTHQDKPETFEGHIASMLSPGINSELKSIVNAAGEDRRKERRLERDLSIELNELLNRQDFYDEQSWSGIELNEEAQELLAQELDQLTQEQLRRFNRLALKAAFPRHIKQRPNRSISFTYFNSDVGIPLPLTDEQFQDIVETTLVTYMDFFLGVIGVFSAILVTASIIPSMFDAGSINLLLSKPISRSLLYLSKFVGGCSFVLINSIYLVVGTWLLLGLRLDFWYPRVLLCIPVFLFLFILYYSVSGLAGLIWRNTIVCITVTVVFWLICFVVGNSKVLIDTFVHSPNRVVRVMKVDDQLFNVLERGQTQLWNPEHASWQDVFSNSSFFGASFLQMNVGPVYDSANQRLLQVQRGWPKFRLFTAVQEDEWSALEVGDAPSETISLINEPDGRILAVSPGGIARFRDEILPAAERPRIFGFELPAPDQTAASDAVVLRPAPTMSSAMQVAVSLTTGKLYLWNDGRLSVYQPEGDDYERTEEVLLSEESQRAVLAVAGKHLLIARADGVVNLLDAETLNQEAEYRPEAKNSPRYAIVSPGGRYFGVIFHTRRFWGYDTKAAAPLDVRWPGQGDISAAAFVSDDELLLVDRGNRVTQCRLPSGDIVASWSPSGSLMQRLSWYLIDPIYAIFPKPGALQSTTNYLLTGKESTSIAQEIESLDSMYVKQDPWTPVWSSLAFAVVVLTISCVYIARQEF